MKKQPITRLGEILQEEGRTQTWLAGKVGVSLTLINAHVHGLHVPNDRRVAIAEALGRTVDDVFPKTEAAA